MQLEEFRLVRPYTIAFRSADSVSNLIVRVDAEGPSGSTLTGWGAGSPEEHVTRETIADCWRAVEPPNLDWMVGRELENPDSLVDELARRMPAAPAARAAVDIALHDLWARAANVPLVDLWGRCHTRLPTSITIGIKGIEETLVEADEYLSRGFRILKVKLGQAVDEDIRRIHELHRRIPAGTVIRVDPNQGYDLAAFRRFVAETGSCGIEFFEQPVPVAGTAGLGVLPLELRNRIALDEAVLDAADARRWLEPEPLAGIVNIKLMKSGGCKAAREIAAVAERAGVHLMWGCMDESRISIAAALHAAFSSPATRYLDLDGHLDLDHDLVTGGFRLEDGFMELTDAPGLGIESWP